MAAASAGGAAAAGRTIAWPAVGRAVDALRAGRIRPFSPTRVPVAPLCVCLYSGWSAMRKGGGDKDVEHQDVADIEVGWPPAGTVKRRRSRSQLWRPTAPTVRERVWRSYLPLNKCVIEKLTLIHTIAARFTLAMGNPKSSMVCYLHAIAQVNLARSPRWCWRTRPSSSWRDPAASAPSWSSSSAGARRCEATCVLPSLPWNNSPFFFFLLSSSVATFFHFSHCPIVGWSRAASRPPLLDRCGRPGRHNGRLSDTTRLEAGCRPPPARV